MSHFLAAGAPSSTGFLRDAHVPRSVAGLLALSPAHAVHAERNSGFHVGQLILYDQFRQARAELKQLVEASARSSSAPAVRFRQTD